MLLWEPLFCCRPFQESTTTYMAVTETSKTSSRWSSFFNTDWRWPRFQLVDWIDWSMQSHSTFPLDQQVLWSNTFYPGWKRHRRELLFGQLFLPSSSSNVSKYWSFFVITKIKFWRLTIIKSNILSQKGRSV